MTSRWKELLAPLSSEHSLAVRQAKAERAALEEAKIEEKDALSAQSLLQEAAEAVQSKAHAQLAEVVTRCLKAVYGEEGSGFRINFRRARGKTEAKLAFVKNWHELAPGDDGGGAIDVASFALRVACLVMSRPPKRRFLALDEPFKHVSANYRGKVRELVEALARDLKIQFLLITHSRKLMIGKVIELGRNESSR